MNRSNVINPSSTKWIQRIELEKSKGTFCSKSHALGHAIPRFVLEICKHNHLKCVNIYETTYISNFPVWWNAGHTCRYSMVIGKFLFSFIFSSVHFLYLWLALVFQIKCPSWNFLETQKVSESNFLEHIFIAGLDFSLLKSHCSISQQKAIGNAYASDWFLGHKSGA